MGEVAHITGPVPGLDKQRSFMPIIPIIPIIPVLPVHILSFPRPNRQEPKAMMPNTSPERSLDVITLGETMALVRAAETGPVEYGSLFRLGMGGAETNVAIALSRLGRGVAWIGLLGDDLGGRLIERELRAEGVEILGGIRAGSRTGLMVKANPAPGRTTVTYYRDGSAGSSLAIDDLDMGAISNARVLHVTGTTLAISSTARAAALAAMRVARDAGVIVSFDVNHRPALWSKDIARPHLQEAMGLANVVFAGRDEARLILGVSDHDDTSDISLLEQLSRNRAAVAVLKLGEAGSIATHNGETISEAAVPVAVVDTVGAGDAFVAGFLHEWLSGNTLRTALATGSLLGAIACEVRGDWEGSPTPKELALFVEQEPVSR
jgi:2-dehydro-3-deoxygluconokinase